MQQLAIILLLAIHLLCVNIAAAGPLVAMWLDWRDGRGDELAGRVGRSLTWHALALLVVGALLGLAMGALQWDESYQRTLLRFDRKVVFAVWEFFFSLGLLVWIALWWRPTQPSGKLGRTLRIICHFLTSTNLLYHFPLLFILIADSSTLSDLPEGARVDAAEFRRLVSSGAVLSRALHFWLAAVAVTGLGIVAIAQRMIRAGSDDASRAVIWGGRIALVPTLLQLPVGVWLLSQMSTAKQSQMLGQDPVTASLLGLSVLAAMWLMHLLSALALGDTTRKTSFLSIGVMIATVTMMAGVLVRIGG